MVETEESIELINQAVYSLSEKYKEVFRSIRYDDFSYKRIADKMDVSVKKVEKYSREALCIVHVKLGD